MRKIALRVLLCGAVLYLLGFFFLIPIMIFSKGTFSRQLIDPMNYELYIKPIKSMSPENPVRAIWNANTIFWCEKLSGCTVEK